MNAHFTRTEKKLWKNWKSAFKNKISRQGIVFQNLISIISLKNKLIIITKNNHSIQRYSFPQNRFYGRWSSQRPTVRLGVKTKMIGLARAWRTYSKLKILHFEFYISSELFPQTRHLQLQSASERPCTL